MTLAEIDRQLAALLDSGVALDDAQWQALLEQRADLLAKLPASPETLQALEVSLLSGARLMAALRAERHAASEELEAARQTLSVHSGYAGDAKGGRREWSA